MTTLPRTHAQRRDWRIARFRIVAGLIAIGILLIDGISIIAPWINLASYHLPVSQATLLRWYEAERGAYAGILWAGSLLALLWRPGSQPLLLQFLILSAAAPVVIGAPIDPWTSITQAAAIALLAISYPNRTALAQYAQHGSFSRPLLALSLPTVALLAFDAWRTLQSQLAAPQGLDPNFIAASTLSITLALSGLLAATKRPGWQALGVLSGAALIYLGLVAAILPNQAGSWGIIGAALATLGGWAFVGATALEMHLETRAVARSHANRLQGITHNSLFE